MRFVCRTCSAVQSVVPERESVCAGCGAHLLSHEEQVSEYVWYVNGPDGQAGPFDASDLARRFDREEMAWTDEVWRDGLRDWRPARKDDVLVVEVASARGLDTATVPLDSLSRLLTMQGEDRESRSAETVLADLPPTVSLARTWPVRSALPRQVRPSRTHAVASAFKLATLALLAFIGGGVVVGLAGRLTRMAWPAHGEPPATLPAASASMVTTAPVAAVPPTSVERVQRTLPAFDEIRAELQRLSPSVQRCVRDPKAGLELTITIAGDTGRPRRIDVRAPRLSSGMIECSRAVLEELSVAPFTSDQLKYTHHYAW